MSAPPTEHRPAARGPWHRIRAVGAGTGSITELYAPGRHVLAIDRSPWCIYEVDKRFAAVDNVEVRKVDLLDLVEEGQRFDSVVMLNVLEHIEDDVAVLRRAREMG